MIIATYKVRGTNRVIRLLSGASVLSQTLVYEDRKMIPLSIATISAKRARELTGNEIGNRKRKFRKKNANEEITNEAFKLD